MFKNYLLIILSGIFLINDVAVAKIYRWVDENGKVNYADDSKDEQPKAVDTMTIKDKYIIPYIEKQAPILYTKEKDNRTVSLSSLLTDMHEDDDIGVRIGRITCGRYPVDLYWTKGVISVESKRLGNAITRIFNNSGYTVENALGTSPRGGSLELRAKFKDIKMNLCPRSSNKQFSKDESFKSEHTKNASFVEIIWTLFDPVTNEQLFETTTKGSHNGIEHGYVENGTDKSLDYAISVSASNLLANKDFVAQLKPGDLSELKKDFKKKINIGYLTGDGSDKFSTMVEYLKNNSVIVKTTDGHGSGVLINNAGFVLTNAHVVGDEKQFTVQLGKQKYSAVLIRIEKIRDVALIKISNYDGEAKGVKFARNEPGIGDELYVIGTPLKMEFQQTITKGIVSAKRKLSGLPFIQTDAAINPGNSGGPVFDDSGELIALAVSGIFTNAGASLNINYLIPIDDVVSTLNIKSQSDLNTIAEQLEGKTVVDSTKTLFIIAKDWLNEPLVRLY